MKRPLLAFDEKGIFCEPAGVYLDPWRPVDKALITHGHSDHARWGHRQYITHHHNKPIITSRLGTISAKGISWGEPLLVNNVKFSFHPAGHIPGSSQIRVEHKGEVWVFTGDYKLEDDGISQPFEPIRCHGFITECTFGIPAFNWRPQEEVFHDINTWWRENKEEGNTSVLFAYSLGKAQRLLKHLDQSIGKVYTHGAIENMTSVLRTFMELPPTIPINKDTPKAEIRGNLILAPPSAHGSVWLRKFAPFVTASASGWMAFRGARRRRAVDRGFVLSDHADWSGLLKAVKATECETVVTTHGYTEIFSRYLREELGYNAYTQHTEFEGDQEENASAEDKETA
ncbi:ligase-associated DNA damage response exonuclease [Robertkochia flava]|uniref:ligase-associated DNA damage response exonuclease n=1 Tax=Robertkochia flava TaxID=3447986 RepID=UPI001CCE3D71|nr:ligase-associated DNA damage response exonuclease [Robertkochia marina]